MTPPDWPTGLPENFGGLDHEFAGLESARAVILPVPYDWRLSNRYNGKRLVEIVEPVL